MSCFLPEQFPALRVINHPLAQHKLTYLRDQECSTSRFRQLMREVGMLLALEVLRGWVGRQAKVTAPENRPVEEAFVLAERVVVVPILRAGLVLADGALEVLGAPYVGHLGLGRNPGKYEEVVEYLCAIPEPDDRLFILMDSVIGTGATACKAIELLLEMGVKPELIKFATVVVAPEGIAMITEKFQDIMKGEFIYTLAIDKGLDQEKHIIPGLGDTSVRLFGK